MDLIKRIQELESSINKRFVKNNIIIRILGSTEKNKGQIIILKDKKINRGFEINVICYTISKYYNSVCISSNGSLSIISNIS